MRERRKSGNHGLLTGGFDKTIYDKIIAEGLKHTARWLQGGPPYHTHLACPSSVSNDFVEK
jgi:hypothetical protein